MSRPQARTIRAVVEHLESIGLAVYGPCLDLDDGERQGANMDYDADQVLRYRYLHEHGMIHDRPEEE